MKKATIRTTYTIYPSDGELPDAEKELLGAAKKALSRSYAPYSRFHVGAAVRLSNDEVVTSTNYENASYPISVCAEHSALIAAANHPSGAVPVALAITVKTAVKTIDRPALPCGSCRQVIVETEQKNNTPLQVILQGETGEVFIFENGRDMLPLAFDGGFL
ncbi:MAG TPA: cytidine deaminase [Bacteroidetes bacterium]|nr:cytidine deaminase [Bacteroidota bacterium]